MGEENPFGQPAPVVLERYERNGVRLLRTDRDGEITASTDGASLDVSAFSAANARPGEVERANHPAFSQR